VPNSIRKAISDPEGEAEELHDPHPRPTGPTLEEAVGGPLGIAEATLPFIVFTVVYAATGQDEITAAALVAVAVSALLAAIRLLRRESVQFALSGVIGVGIGAFVAARTGEASGFFLPGIIINVCWLVAYLGSIAARRPLIGLALSRFTGEEGDWRADRERLRLYFLASWIWVGVFSLRLAIQVPLYISDTVGPLAIARIVTGLPVFAAGLYATYLILKPILDEVELRLPPLPGGGG
jgi:hypothetical protein